jgi:hypothetical protein
MLRLPHQSLKKLDDILKVPLHASSSIKLALRFVANALVGNFIGIWPSPRAVAS